MLAPQNHYGWTVAMKKMSIEAFLNWAFTKELCKVGSGSNVGLALIPSSWGMIGSYAALGTMIDRSPNAYGVIPDFIEDGLPHADAVRAGEAVMGLSSFGFDIPQEWCLFPEWSDERGLVAAEVAKIREEVLIKGDRLAGSHMVSLVTTCAILGRGPDWQADRPLEAMVTSPTGQTRWFALAKAKDAFGRTYRIETDGYNRRTRRPVKGAYRKYHLTSSIRGAILDRLEWQIWQAALSTLYADLEGDLQAHDILPFVPDLEPWSHPQESLKSA
ncbi:hypothetical protein [Agrobacterium vitis]|uniref:hypothetical protein n=1 Tax=Agrobacterium vitis TaxID=373 RepID=UPI001F3CD556|nr:hypothetical protein [Agrobacterium vitis]